MANKYARTVGGNWTADATWSTTSGGAADTTAPTASDDVFLDANSGNVTISATSVGKSLTCTGYTGTLTHNTNIILTLSGNLTLSAGMTYSPADNLARWSFASSATLTSAGKLFGNITVQNGVTITLGDDLNFIDSKSVSMFLITTSTLDTNGKSINGFSTTSRVLITSATLGTARSITNATATTFDKVDFRDITFNTAGALDLTNGQTNLIGDAGGNTASGGTLTFTTAATQTYTGGTDNWSSVAKWTSRVPLPQDNVIMSGVTGGTITADMPRLGKSIDWTGASGSPTWAVNSTANTMYGSLTLISGMTFTHATNAFTFEGRGSFTLTMAGKSFNAATTIAMVGGTMTLQDAMTIGTGGSVFTLSSGTFDANDFNVQFRVFTASSGTTLYMGNGTWTGTTSGNVFTNSSTTFNAESSTLSLESGSAVTFAGGSKTYNEVIFGSGAGSFTMTGSNTISRFRSNGTGTKTVVLPGSTTTTILSGQGLNNGTNVITFTPSSGTATVAKSGGGVVDWDYVNLTNIAASTANTWYAGPITHSTDGGGNTNWIFADAPGGQAISNGQGVVLLADTTKPAYSSFVAQGWSNSGSSAVQPISGDYGI